MAGYIKLHRKITDWEWYKDTATRDVFLHLLLKANYKPSRYMGHDINTGDCIFGRKAFSEELGLGEQQIRTAIKRLKSTSEITIKLTSKFSIITLVNYSKYQVLCDDANQQSNQQTNPELTIIQPATNHIQEVKNNKNNIYTSVLGYLNELADTNFRPSSSKTQTLIRARLNEGFTEENFKTVIRKKVEEWKDTERAIYLRPETLFGTKFESYLNQPEKPAPKSNNPYEGMRQL